LSVKAARAGDTAIAGIAALPLEKHGSGEGPVTAYPDPTLTTSLRTLVKDVKDCWGEAIPVYDDINWYDKKGTGLKEMQSTRDDSPECRTYHGLVSEKVGREEKLKVVRAELKRIVIEMSQIKEAMLRCEQEKHDLNREAIAVTHDTDFKVNELRKDRLCDVFAAGRAQRPNTREQYDAMARKKQAAGTDVKAKLKERVSANDQWMEEAKSTLRTMEEEHAKLCVAEGELKSKIKTLDEIAGHDRMNCIRDNAKDPQHKYFSLDTAGAGNEMSCQLRAAREGSHARYDGDPAALGRAAAGGKLKVDTSHHDALNRSPYGMNSNHLGRTGPVVNKLQLHLDDRL
jgi:hypothetical protein